MKVWFIMLISFCLCSCNNTRTKQIDFNQDRINNDTLKSEDISMNIKDILFKQLEAGCIGEEYGGNTYSKSDLEASLELSHIILKKYDYTVLSQSEFNEKINSFFGRQIDWNSNTDFLCINIDNVSDRKPEYYSWGAESHFLYISKQYLFVSQLYPIPELIDYQKLFPDFMQYENKATPIVHDAIEDAQIEGWKWKDDKNIDKKRTTNINTLVHRNKYIFNDSKSSLTWLVNNDSTFLIYLLTIFGYDKEYKINKLALDKIPKDANDSYNAQDFDNIFATKDVKGKLQIREGLLKYIRENANSNYASMLDIYGNYCIGRDTNSSFTKNDYLKITAYMTYYLRLIYLDNKKRESNNDKYVIVNNMLFKEIGSLVDNEGNPSNEGKNSELLDFIVDNNYFNLPDFKEMVNDIIMDCRL